MGLFDFFKPNKDDGFTVFSPISGEIVPISEVNDKAFSSEIMGKGVAIMPAEGKVYAPANGTISAFFPTGHAVGMITDAGVEILIHIGLDTVNLDGLGFTPIVKRGDKVKKGQLLLEFDIDIIKSEGYNVTTPIIITNTDAYEKVDVIATGKVNVGNKIIHVG